VDTIRIFSRDELKQVQMQSEINDERLRFLIGDVRDKERLLRAFEDIDIVIHAAALKHVPVAEYNPFEAVKTNVNGSENVLNACLDKNVKIALAVGTDKAVSPFNTYGATKLLMEKLFVSGNYYKGRERENLKFLCVRYGNVLGSRGSIVPTLSKQIVDGKKITITDPNMTRFNITMNQALDLIFRALKQGDGGQVFIPKLKAYRVEDMKDVIVDLMDAKNDVETISVRPGEKFHEVLISKDEIRNTLESENDYIVYDEKLINKNNLPLAKLTDHYSSDKVELFTKKELKEILENEKILPLFK
jgi:UDP-N-acetylglucosamine 4,6-dehydratase/UDP-glucose 4-epimerase